jgi:hypothetical protein
VRYKIVPPARDREFLLAVRDALPLVPGSVEDCCTRIRDGTDVPSRDAAREWLTFCQALGLAAETDRGYHRLRETPGADVLAERLRANVFPAREVQAVLAGAGDPVGADAVFASVRETVPNWERSRSRDWADTWRERIAHLLDWLVAFDVARTIDGGYRLG